jgi:hypothetical protein
MWGFWTSAGIRSLSPAAGRSQWKEIPSFGHNELLSPELTTSQQRRQYRHVESIFPVTLLRTVSMAEPTEQNATHEGIAKGE